MHASKTHGIIDYLAEIVLFALPRLLGWAVAGPYDVSPSPFTGIIPAHVADDGCGVEGVAVRTSITASGQFSPAKRAASRQLVRNGALCRTV
jgi:hypothetical protein